jgi:hypothetical protein
MPEPHYRLVYDATIDDAVDVGMRLANTSHAYRRQVRQNIIIAGVVGGSAVIAVGIFYLTEPGPLELIFGAVAAIAFGVAFAFMFKRFFLKEILKQSRKVITEQFDGKPTVACELELRSDSVWIRQAGMEMVFPWTLCRGIQDNADDIEMKFAAGLCVVRNRHLPSAAERQRFLDTARRLAGK